MGELEASDVAVMEKNLVDLGADEFPFCECEGEDSLKKFHIDPGLLVEGEVKILSEVDDAFAELLD